MTVLPTCSRHRCWILSIPGSRYPSAPIHLHIRDADVCIFSAGLPRNPSVKTRADLLEANLPATRDGIALLKGFSGILITVTNPMDVNNFVLCKKTGIGRERCIGFGGQLDSARFGLALRNRGITGFPFVLGEHGEHQVPLFSSLSSRMENGQREEILAELRGASMEVIRGKGGTVFGPALHLAQLTRMVLKDARELIACSAVLEGEYGLSGCSLGVPCRCRTNGIRKIEEWALDAWETGKDERGGTVCQRTLYTRRCPDMASQSAPARIPAFRRVVHLTRSPI